jgi:polysaccharide biosynthesis transport protein
VNVVRAAAGDTPRDGAVYIDNGQAMPALDSRSMLSVARILAVLRKRKWWLIASMAIALVLGLVVTLLMTPQYTATTTVEIQRETRNFTNVDGVESRTQSAVDPEFYETQLGLLRSSSLAESVASDMRLQDSWSFFDRFGSKKAGKWFQDGKLIPAASTREVRLREAGDLLLKRVNVQIPRLSRLATISVTSPDAVFSKRVADAWSSHFIQQTLDRRYAATAYARKFLEGRLAQLKSRINETERDLVNYAASKNIVTLPSEGAASPSGSAPERSLIADDLAALNRELARAVAERIEAQSRLGARGGDVQEALANQGISQMRGRLSELTSQYAEMMQKFDPGYQPAMALRAQISATEQSIAREENRVRSTLRQSFDAAKSREAALSSRVQDLTGKLFDLRRRSTEYNILQRDVDTNRQLYEALLQRYKEIGVAGGIGVNNIAVVDPADLPTKPSSPRLLLNVALSLLAGLLAGIGLTIALEQLEDSLADPAEVPELLGIPLIGVVPKVAEDPILSLYDPKSPISEAYFSVQTALALATMHGFPRTLVITSSRASEGKSLTSLGIAKTLAATGKRVLLIDADMRSPSVHQMLGCALTPGLSNLATGANTVEDVIQPSGTDNLWIVAAGPQPPSSAELLSGNRFELLQNRLMENFDHIIVDGPPVMGFADAPLLASQVEGVCFVIEAHGTNKANARAAISRLSAVGATMFGAVVSKFDVKRAHYGYGYNYGYGYGYGADREAKSS